MGMISSISKFFSMYRFLILYVWKNFFQSRYIFCFQAYTPFHTSKTHYSNRIKKLIKVFRILIYRKDWRVTDESRFHQYIFIYLYQKVSDQEKQFFWIMEARWVWPKPYLTMVMLGVCQAQLHWVWPLPDLKVTGTNTGYTQLPFWGWLTLDPYWGLALPDPMCRFDRWR
jgi:hypothetical protein